MKHTTARSRRTALAAGLAGLSLLAAPALAHAEAAGSPGLGTIELVALRDSDGGQAAEKSHLNGSAQVASEDGRYVVFSTTAALVPQDTDGFSDVYLRDTLEGRTRLVSASVLRQGRQRGQLRADDLGDRRRGGLHDRRDQPGDQRRGRQRSRPRRGVQAAARWRRGTRVRPQRRHPAGRNSFFPVFSGDGLVVAFQTFGRFASTDADRREDVYVHSTETGRTRQASLVGRGRDVGASVLVGDVSHWGRWVTFGNDHDVWVRDLGAGTTRRVWHEANDPAQPFPMGSVGRPVISGDGRFVAFSTMSTAIVAGEKGHRNDIFRVRLSTGKVRKVTVAAGGGRADDHSFIPSLSSRAVRGVLLVRGQPGHPATLQGSDVVVRDMRGGTTRLASAGVDGTADGESGRTAVAISDDGRTLVYESYAANLVAEDTNGVPEVFAWRR